MLQQLRGHPVRLAAAGWARLAALLVLTWGLMGSDGGARTELPDGLRAHLQQRLEAFAALCGSATPVEVTWRTNLLTFSPPSVLVHRLSTGSGCFVLDVLRDEAVVERWTLDERRLTHADLTQQVGHRLWWPMGAQMPPITAGPGPCEDPVPPTFADVSDLLCDVLPMPSLIHLCELVRPGGVPRLLLAHAYERQGIAADGGWTVYQRARVGRLDHAIYRTLICYDETHASIPQMETRTRTVDDQGARPERVAQNRFHRDAEGRIVAVDRVYQGRCVVRRELVREQALPLAQFQARLRESLMDRIDHVYDMGTGHELAGEP